MIKEVILRKFKKFHNETFNLSGHVILAGPNNCGKTTVLQAVAAWSLALKTWKQLHDYQKHGGWYTKAPISRQSFSAVPVRTFELLWKDRNYGGDFEIEVLLDNGSRIAMEFISNSTEQIFVRPKNSVFAHTIEHLNLEVVYVSTVGGLSVEEPVYQADYIQTLLGRQRPGDVIRNLLLQASQGNSWEPLTKAVTRLFGVQLQVPQTPGGQIVCEYKQSGTGPNFDLLSAGSGFQQVVLLLASLFTRKGSVMLVDEPDAHLHVFLQDSIFAELNKAAAETNSQLIIATHSEVIFNSADPEQICVMMGTKPRRLASANEVQKLRQAVAVLQQSDLIAALAAPGILYLEGYTDLNLLREWARILNHSVANYLNRTPFWQPIVWNPTEGSEAIKAQEHYAALQLVKEDMTGIWVVDGDGKNKVGMSTAPEKAKLNRISWKRYETESYLLHPAALARFIDKQVTLGGPQAVKSYLTREFEKLAGTGLGDPIAAAFIADPLHPAQIVETYLAATKARTKVVGGILEEGGVHGMSYTDFHQIAAQMLPEEINHEVKEKLDFIQQAFGL